jgi:hypothetical protein
MTTNFPPTPQDAREHFVCRTVEHSLRAELATARSTIAEREALLAEWVDNYIAPAGAARLDFTKRVMNALIPGCDTFEEWRERRARLPAGTPPTGTPPDAKPLTPGDR